MDNIDDPATSGDHSNDTQPAGGSTGAGSKAQPVDDPQSGAYTDAPWEHSKDRPPFAVDADMLAGVPPASLDSVSDESPRADDDSDSAS